jgi:drug/metabolite transporter (DMT)-like permease
VVAIAGVIMLFFHSIGQAWSRTCGGGSGQFLLGLAAGGRRDHGQFGRQRGGGQGARHSSNLLLTMAWSMLWGTLMVAASRWRAASALLPPTAQYWMGLLYLSIFGSVIAFAAYFTLINRIGSQKAVYIGVVTPVLSVLLSIRLEHYRPGAVEWLGMRCAWPAWPGRCAPSPGARGQAAPAPFPEKQAALTAD